MPRPAGRGMAPALAAGSISPWRSGLRRYDEARTVIMSRFLSRKYLKFREAAAHGPIDEDVTCPHCGYILRGLRYGQNCPECGQLMMVRNGTCLKCMACGTTTGCSYPPVATNHPNGRGAGRARSVCQGPARHVTAREYWRFRTSLTSRQQFAPGVTSSTHT